MWAVALNLGYYGFGAGLMLVALHHASMQSISQDQMGMAAGVYSMLRFMGLAIGTALAGVILQRFLDLSMPAINAYQKVFLFYCSFPVLGVISATGLVERKKQSVQ
jgi:MFS family permease